MPDVMVDLETLGNTPGSAILSIGAVTFDAQTGVIGEGLYAVVSRASCRRAGLHEDEDTLAWWEKQGAEAREVLFHAEGMLAMPLPAALLWLNFYLEKAAMGGGALRLWGNGADFDNALISAALRACGLKPEWKFWNNRCYRTLKSLFPEIRIERAGTHHNALDDARTQAEHAIRILRHQAGALYRPGEA